MGTKVRAGKGETKVLEKEREESDRKPWRTQTRSYVRCLSSWEMRQRRENCKGEINRRKCSVGV